MRLYVLTVSTAQDEECTARVWQRYPVLHTAPRAHIIACIYLHATLRQYIAEGALNVCALHNTC